MLISSGSGGSLQRAPEGPEFQKGSEVSLPPALTLEKWQRQGGQGRGFPTLFSDPRLGHRPQGLAEEEKGEEGSILGSKSLQHHGASQSCSTCQSQVGSACSSVSQDQGPVQQAGKIDIGSTT